MYQRKIWRTHLISKYSLILGSMLTFPTFLHVMVARNLAKNTFTRALFEFGIQHFKRISYRLFAISSLISLCSTVSYFALLCDKNLWFDGKKYFVDKVERQEPMVTIRLFPLLVKYLPSYKSHFVFIRWQIFPIPKQFFGAFLGIMFDSV